MTDSKLSSWCRRLLLLAMLNLIGAAEANSSVADNRGAHIGVAKVVNRLAACLSLSKDRVVRNETMTALEVRGAMKASLAHCGCVSSLMSYRVLEGVRVDSELVDYERASGLLAAPNVAGQTKMFTIPLIVDADVVLVGPLTIEIACKQPD